jgi:alpha-galactosidase
MTDEEYRAHFSLWAMIAAPLIAGNDLRSMTPATKVILTNKELIAVNQDKLGKAARRVKRVGDIDVWSKELADGGRAVALLNRGEASAEISFDWADIGLPGGRAHEVRDLWTHRNLGKQNKIAASVPRHSVVVLRVARR